MVNLSISDFEFIYSNEEQRIYLGIKSKNILFDISGCCNSWKLNENTNVGSVRTLSKNKIVNSKAFNRIIDLELNINKENFIMQNRLTIEQKKRLIASKL